MRRLMLGLGAVTILAMTAVTGLTAGGVLVRSTEPSIQKHQISAGGVGAIGEQGFFRGRSYILTKGDMSGMGGGAGMGKGGMKGDMMGGMGKGQDKKG
jgi:hypothetical protein